MYPVTAVAPPPPPAAPVATLEAPLVTIEDLLSQLVVMERDNSETDKFASTLLKFIDSLPRIEKIRHQQRVADVMGWTNKQRDQVLKDLHKDWYSSNAGNEAFFNECVYVRKGNYFYDRDKNIVYSPEAYQNAHSSIDREARKNALEGDLVTKVDTLDYAPLQPPVFVEKGVTYGNLWSDVSEVDGVVGDIAPYLRHWDIIGWGEHRDYVMQWMAYTIRHPDIKINHMLIMGGGEGIGKDWLLYPLLIGMGKNAKTIPGSELLSNFNSFMLSCKYLQITEAELADHREAKMVTDKLKPMVAAPPDTLRVEMKGKDAIDVRNLLSVTMTTNSSQPLKITGGSRRIYAMWSDLNMRGEDGSISEPWQAYWNGLWKWMKGGGAEAVIHHLRNEVCLKNFNPGASPPMTEFLNDIQSMSRSPLSEAVEEMIDLDILRQDLMTAGDLATRIKVHAGDKGMSAHLLISHIKSENVTPRWISQVMSEIRGVVRLRAQAKRRGQVRVWVMRNAEKYKAMGSADLYREYERQLILSRGETPLEVV